MNGKTAVCLWLEMLRTSVLLVDVPVIVLSAAHRDPPPGVLAFFAKPVEIASLLALLRKHFD